MINQRLFINKFCNNSKMLLSSFWAIFIRALVFSSSPRANFSSFQYLCFSFLLIFRFILIYYTGVKTEKNYIIIKIEKFQLCFDTIKNSHVLSIRNYNAVTSEIQTRRNIERVFCYCRDLKMSWLEHFQTTL